MYNGQRVLVVVPARGGSKGIKLKNIFPVVGKPLISYTGQLVRQIDLVDRAVASTDHPDIAREAIAAGLDVPFERSEELSGDRIGDADVLRHALVEMERIDSVQYDVVVMLQPTCPLRTAQHVTDSITTLVDGKWDAVWTVSPTDLKYHPLKQLTVTAEGQLAHFDQRGDAIIARQQLAPVYHRNGAAYAISRQTLLAERTILGARCTAVVVDEPLVSIDTLDDIRQVEDLILARMTPETSRSNPAA